jgi:c(7)-type cytochrome triheme protein
MIKFLYHYAGRNQMKIKLLIILCALLIGTSFVLAETLGIKKRMPLPHEYGEVIINNYSEKENLAPVVFPHWIHRAKYTCRVCHIDVGFAMEAGGTDIREKNIRKGFYCGTCHDGVVAFGIKETSSTGREIENCEKCHSYEKDVEFKNDFYEFAKKLPRARFGNKIDWLKAEELKLVTLIDYIEGLSFKRRPLMIKDDFEIKTTEEGMPAIIFSHKKHTVWNGCELCHPEIFHVKKGSTPYEMKDIFDGKFCGECHGKVAFTTHDCQLCHSESVN